MYPVTARFSLYVHPNTLVFQRSVSLQFPPFLGMSIGGFTVDAINVETNGRVTCSGKIEPNHLNVRPISDKARDAYIASMQKGRWRLEVVGPGIEKAIDNSEGKFEDPALAGVKMESMQDMVNTPPYFAGKAGAGTATGEQVAKLNAAPDDADPAMMQEFNRQLRALVRDTEAEVERLKAVNHALIDAHHKELAALGSHSPGILIDACEDLFRECPIALILAAEGVSVLTTLQSALKLAKARAAAVEIT